MNLRRAVEADRSRLAALAAAQQARPDRHVAYLGLDATTIAAEMVDEDEDWTAATALAEEDGTLVGWLMGSVDAELGRVWWFGPFVEDLDGAPRATQRDQRWRDAADALYVTAQHLLPDGVDQQELCGDARFSMLADWAGAHGFVEDSAAAVLTLDHELAPPRHPVRPLVPDDHGAVAGLHDELFPGTHADGAGLVRRTDPDHLRLVAVLDDRLVGYVAAERQPDGEGYIDYLGVAPAARRLGLGADLVRAAVAALRGLGCTRTHLTVRATNTAARGLYAHLGFTEERVIVPYRRGFTLV